MSPSVCIRVTPTVLFLPGTNVVRERHRFADGLAGYAAEKPGPFIEQFH